jgi:exosortase
MNLTRKPWPQTLAIILGVLTLAVLMPYSAGYGDYRKTLFQHLLIHWLAPDLTTWQYGILGTPVAVWLIWKQQARFQKLSVHGSWTGLAILVFAMFTYWVGYRASSYYFGYAAVQLFLAGAVVWSLGWRWMRALLFPWLVIATMWPLVFLEDRLSFPLRLISHQAVMSLAEIVHAPILAEGTTILSVDTDGKIGSWMTLQVEGPCSGMNSLFALMFVSLIYSYHAQRTLPGRVLLFLCSIPMAILSNILRIIILIIGCALFGQDFAIGTAEIEMSGFHLITGLFCFLMAMQGMRQISPLIRRLFPLQRNNTTASMPAASQPTVNA